jgi:hypothetical protein
VYIFNKQEERIQAARAAGADRAAGLGLSARSGRAAGPRLSAQAGLTAAVFAGLFGFPISVWAAPAVTIDAGFKNLISIIMTVVQYAGVLALIFGFVQLGLAIQGHDPSQRTTAILCLAGGLLLVSMKSLLTTLGITVA